MEHLSVPGRINLIGEHIDYHNLPVLPMAIQRCIRIAYRPAADTAIQASSAGYGQRSFSIEEARQPSLGGDWANYLKAAVQAAQSRWPAAKGIDATISSDLPAAAGLSSSSALLTGFTLALLRANGISPAFDELMSILPEAEQFVGTRGGSMDHAVVLGARTGCALLIEFAPLKIQPVSIPRDWAFLVAHSLTTAEKSGAVRAEYNARRMAGIRALQKLKLSSYAAALVDLESVDIEELDEPERLAFAHVTTEALRVRQALQALEADDLAGFGNLLIASHASLRDYLRVSTPALDSLVEAALESGAVGARLTGAGFGGCVIAVCEFAQRDRIREQLIERYYRKLANFDPATHLFFAEPSSGALA